MHGRDPGEGLGGGAGLADHLDVALDGQQVVDAPPDHLVVVEQKYSDMSVCRHVQRVPYRMPGDPSPAPGRTTAPPAHRPYGARPAPPPRPRTAGARPVTRCRAGKNRSPLPPYAEPAARIACAGVLHGTTVRAAPHLPLPDVNN
ncbi:hypothetical protein GCM10018781_74080 [Kitasatospora indigofera]|uniref:Uncharacterized protein n=1 Tax=Kitasatospora indigofera TaxID=67307 RepID=A0A919GHL0_9ACTN|nr:hypothetical protein GCM10018781_74080 [Kitasatospora indigofera]